MKIISWNTAHRVSKVGDQIEAIRARSPDIVALQEVVASSALELSAGLEAMGLAYNTHSELRSVDSRESKSRSYFVLVASRYPTIPARPMRLPWPEKGISLVAETEFGPIEIHSVHVPPGSSNGWLKVDVFEAIYAGLAVRSPYLRVLCGDFNSP